MEVENLRIASDAFNEAQRNVSKAQELVDRYEGKMKETEEQPNFVGGTDALYFIERLKDAKELLKEREKSLIVREKSLKEREQHAILVQMDSSSSSTTDTHGHATALSTVTSREFEDARRYLLTKIDNMEASIDKQADSYKDQLRRMKAEIEGFVCVPSTGFANVFNIFPPFQINNDNGPLVLQEGASTTSIQGYKVHIYDGAMHRVPSGWRMPRCNVRSLWTQWWLGEPSGQIAPLRFFTNNDVSHLDKIPLSESEMKGRSGKFQAKRRQSRKTLSDIRVLMNYITAMVEEVGAMEDVITPASVNRMFESISHKLRIVYAKCDQNKWTSLARKLR